MLTRWPAFAIFQEKEKGSIAAGKFADLTILFDDVMKNRGEIDNNAGELGTTAR